MKKRFSFAGIALIILAGGGWFVTRLPSSPFDGAAPQATPDLIARGEYVARQADCVACHSLEDGAPFAGGLEMGTPLGSIFATNITPDPQTGIGTYTLADFDRALRHGVTPDRRRLYPAMPYPSYEKMSDDDISALYAFFMNDVTPVQQAAAQSDIPWPLNIRWPLALWNVVFTTGQTYQTDPDQSEQWNRGAYLVEGAGHCGSCHTPRGMAMNEQGLDSSDPDFLSGALLDGWFAPSLRGDGAAGIGRWSEDDLFAFLSQGRNDHAVVFGSMTEAFNNSLQFMTDDDLRAISVYLKSLPGQGPGWQAQPATVTSLVEAAQSGLPGAETYMANCAACHGRDGLGQNEWIPALAGATSSQGTEPASQINVTLNGSGRVVADGMPDSYRMPPYRDRLNDTQIAEVLQFVRSSWGNTGTPVDTDAVADLRMRTDPASVAPIVLQMR
ncbi:alcohol dehydrogenase [Thioclava sp. SK-1]|uniref:c-type cytochrome n=1 Tax=Thioclava sp. SK-1 TaxID=1889770 RepID=UPI0008264BB4|nr:cytochrome c [Thioclava sp. SK-1]OCX66932.1 alcohol dehydrogenase [Thioclava sp. SK-1]